MNSILINLFIAILIFSSITTSPLVRQMSEDEENPAEETTIADKTTISSETTQSLNVCENSNAEVTCDNGNIKILSANFGRTDSSTCSSDIDPYYLSNTDCKSDQLKSITSICNDQQTCTLSSNVFTFGDPCVNVFKYLSVTYQCI